MSLNLSNEGYSCNSVPVTEGVKALNESIFDVGSGVGAAILDVQIHTGGSDFDLADLASPSTLGVCPGAMLKITKTDDTKGEVIYTHPKFTKGEGENAEPLVYNFVNKCGEYVCLVAVCEGETDEWFIL